MLAFAPGSLRAAPRRLAAPEAAQPQTQAPAIKKVEVVDLTELPTAQQTQVNDGDVQNDGGRSQGSARFDRREHGRAAALKAEGIGSEAVIAALMSSDGTLTLVTKKS